MHKNMTNNEMLMAAIEFEEVEYAYDLLFLIQEGFANPNAEFNISGEDWNRVDKNVVNEWQNMNLLNFDLVHLFACRINASDWMLIMARTEEEARGYALNKLGALPKLIKMPHHKWSTEFWFDDTREYKSLLDLRKEIVSFPTHLII